MSENLRLSPPAARRPNKSQPTHIMQPRTPKVNTASVTPAIAHAQVGEASRTQMFHNMRIWRRVDATKHKER